MSRVTTPKLAAAICDAGALGMIAVGRLAPDAALALVDQVEALTPRPFGAGFIVPFITSAELVEAVAGRVGIVEFFYGWPDPALVHPGTITGWQVGGPDEAQAAVDAGCRFVIAQGVEAGGHVRGTTPLLDLLPTVREAVEVPVVAAGGLGTAAEVVAALERGADAVRIGTRFLAAVEADVHSRYLELLFAADADDSEYTGLFDVGWPDAPVRVLASAVRAATEYAGDVVGYQGDVPLPRFGTSPPTRSTTGAIEAMALYAGRSVGAVTRPMSAADIVGELMNRTLDPHAKNQNDLQEMTK